MGQEVVSEMGKSFDDNCNLFFNENLEMDIQISRKEIIMKSNGKKRIFALLMCVMMIGSSMSVWAAYASRTIGTTPNERAFCELSLEDDYGRAYTTPVSPSTSVTTAIAVIDNNGNMFSNDGSRSAYRYAANAVAAASTHQAGVYYTSLDV